MNGAWNPADFSRVGSRTCCSCLSSTTVARSASNIVRDFSTAATNAMRRIVFSNNKGLAPASLVWVYCVNSSLLWVDSLVGLAKLHTDSQQVRSGEKCRGISVGVGWLKQEQ